MRFTYSVATMGCKANLTDSQALEARLRDWGGSPAPEGEADLHVLNTCTVTDGADREAEARLKKSQAKLTVVTGCMAEVSSDRLAKFSSDKVVIARNSAKGEIPAAVLGWLEKQTTPMLLTGDRAEWHGKADHLPGAAHTAPDASEHRTRAFLKVQDGCNAFCSYCIIPHARGRSRSIGKELLLKEVQSLAEAGVQEVVLTAIHAADYADGETDFTGLVEYILDHSSVARLRLTSLDPAEISTRLLERMAGDSRLCPHLHVSLQSGSTSVLRAMKRAYDAARAGECLDEIARILPHAFIGMDVIAGFPGESDAEHAETEAFLRAHPWTRLHVFPYSVRRSTAAARMVEAGLGVPNHILHERARALRELSEARCASVLDSRSGGLMEILTEEKRVQRGAEVFTQGHARSYFRVLVPGEWPANSRLRVRIRGVAAGESLIGEVV